MSLDKAVDNFLGEYFKSYVLVAYDYNGVCYTYSNIKNQEEKDSLTLALDRAYDDITNEIDYENEEY